MGKEYQDEYCKYEFSESEKREIATEMAQKIAELERSELEKKAIMSDLKSRIDSLQAQINASATRINNGYEMRNIRCEVVYDHDLKIIHYYRTDNGELAKTRKMSNADMQLKVFEGGGKAS